VSIPVDQRERREPRPETEQDIAAAQRFYTRISHVYDALTDAGERTARDLGLKMLDAQTDEQILEVGFATGTGVVHIARAVGEHGRVLGLDISEGMRNVAARRVASSDVSAVVELQIAGIPPIPATNDEFDAIFMAFTLELFPDDTIRRVLREIQRVLKPSGRFVVVAMDSGDEGQKWRVAGRTYRWLHDHFPHVIDCRPIEVASLIRGEGFSISEAKTVEIWGLPVTVCRSLIGHGDGRQP